ncbi:2-oxo-tetronate isomerase [Pelomonas sp. SE-A7]|uniref:2-oxo-tetronate isomerase n=1 Tax=Pelomonas sp. SE-A7 TaxID=3054953 RepID=UPI00259CC52B|nr:2-oxo-tetronate isomerase [Pelomonas sp. SE-A7]MDM4767601.1 TIM barrel protein [Pelomonas sp. SE-A7]
MPRFAANLSLQYGEQPQFLDRFAAAAADGFRAVEYLFPYEHAPEVLAGQLRQHGLQQVLFNAPPGDWAAGERGLTCLPSRERDFEASVEQALSYARALDCPRIHLMSGLLPEGHSREQLKPLVVERLLWACDQAAAAGITLLLEPINGRDMPGYFLNRQDHALELIAAVARPNLKLQMDWYHCQVVEGDVATKLRRTMELGLLGHVQLAGVPLRQEPDQGELRTEYLLEQLDELGYQGWVGCEYRPRAGTSAGLGWIRRWMPAIQPIRP